MQRILSIWTYVFLWRSSAILTEAFRVLPSALLHSPSCYSYPRHDPDQAFNKASNRRCLVRQPVRQLASSEQPSHDNHPTRSTPDFMPSFEPPIVLLSMPDDIMTRGRALGVGLSGLIAGLTLVGKSSSALDPIRKSQEQWRIWNQEEADNVLGGGELASPEGGKTLQPVLALIPIVTLRLRLDSVEASLKDPRRFGEGLAILQSQEFRKGSIKRVFNAYSDNIYYLPDSDRENKYLQGGATPSSRQTLQYLLRNDVIDNVEALTAEIAYLIRERETGGSDLDEKDMRMYLAACKGGFDQYLGMVLQNEIDEATEYAKMALATNKRN